MTMDYATPCSGSNAVGDAWFAFAAWPDGRHERLCRHLHSRSDLAIKCARKQIRESVGETEPSGGESSQED